MRKTIVLGAILIGLQIPLLAYVLVQERTWGGSERDGAIGVAAAGDGSVYVTGSTLSFGAGGEDAFLLKYDAGGSLQWERTYGTAPDELSGDESGIDVAVAPDGSGVVVLGNYRGGKIFLAKFLPDGTLLWDLTWASTASDVSEGAAGLAISATNGTIYVTGTTSGPGITDAFILSFTAGGSLNWQRTWGGPFSTFGRGVAVATDGSIYISGETVFSANAAFLVKFDSAGSVLWEREWGVVGKGGFPENHATTGNSVAAAPNGGAYVAGETTGTGFSANFVAVHFNANGDFVWQKVGGPGFGEAFDIAVGPEGNVHVAGYVLTDGGDSGVNAFVWTLQANGKGSDAAVWGGDDPFVGERAFSIAAAPAGDIVAVGIAGAIPPPYVFDRGSKNAKAVDMFLNTIVGTVTEPAGAAEPPTPAAVVTTPAGSETFAGESDAFLLRVRQ
jgi:hypothetical protein